MKKKGSNKIVITDSFQAWAHKWGRIGTLIALLYMIAIPFVVLTFYDSLPSIGEVINLSTISILMVYIPVGFSEAISYTPILGASSYLTFITGNIMNLKLPCAVNAMKLAKKEPNTPEGEAISSALGHQLLPPLPRPLWQNRHRLRLPLKGRPGRLS